MRIRLSPTANLSITTTGVLASSPRGHFELKGRDVQAFVQQLLPLLDGSRTEAQLAGALPGIDPASVRSFLGLLRERGITELVTDAGRAAQERLFQGLGLPAGAGAQALAAAHVAVVGLCPLGIIAAVQLAAAGVGRLSLYGDRPLSEDDALALQGVVGVLSSSDPATVAVGAVRRAAPGCTVEAFSVPPALRRNDMGAVHPFSPAPHLILSTAAPEEMLLRFQLERAAQAAGVTSFSAHLEGSEVWLGPVSVPGQTACWNCLRMRRLAHRDDVVAAHQEQAQCMSGQVGPGPRALLAPMVPAAGSLLAIEALKLLSGAPASRELVGRARVHHLISGTSSLHGIVRMPWCPVCGGAQQALDAVRASGADVSNVSSPLVTDLPTLFSRLEGWLDPRCGIIRSFEGHPATSPPLPRTASARAAHFTEGDPSRVDINLFGGGKGLTDFSAQIGAIGETIERYSASRYRSSDLVRARIDQLQGDVLDPRRLCLYEDHIYRAQDNPYVPFHPSMPIDWVRGHWFGTRDPVWVPALAAFFSYRAPQGEQLFQVSSSGLAAGASTVDAAVRATFELVERDATMLTWLCQLPGRPIRLDVPFQDGMDQVVASIHAQGVRIEPYLLDVGTGLPTVFCLGFGDGKRAPAVTASLACHGDLRTALRKALLELAHVNPYLASIAAERIPRSADGVRTLEDHAFLYIPRGREQAFAFLRGGGLPPLPVSAIPARTFPTDPLQAAAVVAERLRAAELKVAIVELTSPDVAFTPFRVARAVGVDMQPIHFGYHLRRLRSPRLQARLGPAGINPHPHPIA